MSLVGVQAIAFDLDDTLIDWPTGIARAAAAVGAPEISERVRDATWVKRDAVVVDRQHWRTLHEPEAFMAADLVEPFLAALDPPLFADVMPTIDALRGEVRLALLTNNPFGTQVVERHGLHVNVFDCVVIADPCLRKPDPRAFESLVTALRVPVRDIAYVGDSVPSDVEGAIRAGLRAVWLDRWTDPWLPPEGVVRITSLLELPELC